MGEGDPREPSEEDKQAGLGLGDVCWPSESSL